MDYGTILMSEIIENIKYILKDKIAPSVAAHNGKINFISFDEESGLYIVYNKNTGKILKSIEYNAVNFDSIVDSD